MNSKYSKVSQNIIKEYVQLEKREKECFVVMYNLVFGHLSYLENLIKKAIIKFQGQ